MQVWNSSSYCSTDLIYTCVNENEAVNIWDIYKQGRSSPTNIAIVGNFPGSRDLGSTVAVYRVTHINSTSLASTLVLTPTQSTNALSQIFYRIDCNDIRAENTPRSLISSK